MAAFPLMRTVSMKRFMEIVRSRNFHLRIMSAVFMIPIGLYAVWAGGIAAVVIVALEAMVIYYEWVTLSKASKIFLFWLSQLLIATAALLLALQANEFAAIFLLILTLIIGVLHSVFRNVDSWRSLGLLYAVAFLVSLILLRESPQLGFEATLFIVMTVWVTDTFAYIAGSLIGGRKLAPGISPKKTWAGFYGGLTAGTLAGSLTAYKLDLESWPFLILVSLFLSIAAQIGDLFESWLKRSYNVKDSSALIPGHGGLLDRLDSLVAASILAYAIGASRAGLASPAIGLLSW